MPKKRSLLQSILLGAAILAAMVIYAYGFQVTKFNLDETKDPRRQTQLTRILRALARPDIFEYDKEEYIISLPVFTPCPANLPAAPAVEPDAPYLVMTPACAEPGSMVTVEGFNFEPNTTGPLNFIPPSGVSLQIGNIETDAHGHFVLSARLPKRPDTVAQELRAITRRNVGVPHFSKNAIETWDKIIETVFLALLATTLGVLIAVPASFLAARNIMVPITSPLTSVALSILLIPLGLVAGWTVSDWMRHASTALTANLWVNLVTALVVPVLIWFGVRWALPSEEIEKPKTTLRIARLTVLVFVALLTVLELYLVSGMSIRLGNALVQPCTGNGFLGKFFSNLGDLLDYAINLLVAIAGAGLLGDLASKFGQRIVDYKNHLVNRIINAVLGTAAGATLFALIGAGVNWLYQFDNPTYTLVIPAIVGALIGLITTAALSRNATLPIGFVIYTLTRTLFNGLRSIESLVMVIVFAVWVGIGPFAGVLALALHTIASNAKLYSEQVEGIMAGPLEAITATGANRLQTIIYAVIPQIIPPYISYTMYRWDINVRMSTIIGFAGGGGIGFLLQQNINLLNYRAASTQMLAIAIVVATMDYLSAKMREKVI